MTTDYSEKRNFFRMHLDCDMEYSLNGSDEKRCGIMKNLSGDGVLFLAEQEIEPGSEIYIAITPENTVTPPLSVTVEVLRCSPAEGEGYEIAGNITKR
jgi:hypothetical protein